MGFPGGLYQHFTNHVGLPQLYRKTPEESKLGN